MLWVAEASNVGGVTTGIGARLVLTVVMLVLLATGTAGNDCCRMAVCGDHDVIVFRRSQTGEKEFAGHRIRHRRTNDVTISPGLIPQHGC